MTQAIFRAAVAALVFSLALALIGSPVLAPPPAAGTYNLPRPRPIVAQILKAVGREAPR